MNKSDVNKGLERLSDRFNNVYVDVFTHYEEIRIHLHNTRRDDLKTMSSHHFYFNALRNDAFQALEKEYFHKELQQLYKRPPYTKNNSKGISPESLSLSYSKSDTTGFNRITFKGKSSNKNPQLSPGATESLDMDYV